MAERPRVLLVGAAGFVGRYASPALRAAGYALRCTTRSTPPDAPSDVDVDWVQLDVRREDSLAPALAGCDAAVYLAHGMRDGPGYADRELQAAAAFHAAARAATIRRIVYLGAVEPAGPPSPHLKSRLDVGRILRASGTSTVELRAGLIVGHGGESWLMVRDLARRLPMMVLPRWLQNRAQPVAIDDVVAAILRALELDTSGSVCADVPGPEVLTHRELLRRTSAAFDQHPVMIDVPVLTPRLSCYWITLFTRANRHMAKELVEGLTSDLLAHDDGIFAEMKGYARTALDVGIRAALDDEKRAEIPAPSALERMRRLGEAFG